MEEEKLEKTIQKQPKILHVQLYKLKNRLRQIYTYNKSLNEIKSSLKRKKQQFHLDYRNKIKCLLSLRHT